jgi:hypothetical protein
MISCRKCIQQFESKIKLDTHVKKVHQQTASINGVKIERLDGKFQCPFVDEYNNQCHTKSIYPKSIQRHYRNMHHPMEFKNESSDDLSELNSLLSSSDESSSTTISNSSEEESDSENSSISQLSDGENSNPKEDDIVTTNDLDTIGFKFNQRFGLFICMNTNKKTDAPCGYPVEKYSILNHLILSHDRSRTNAFCTLVEKAISIIDENDEFEEVIGESTAINPVQGIPIIQSGYWCMFEDDENFQCPYATNSINSYRAHIAVHPDHKNILLKTGPIQAMSSKRNYVKVIAEDIHDLNRENIENNQKPSIKRKYDILISTLLNDNDISKFIPLSLYT